MLRAEYQLVCHGNKIADSLKPILLRNGAGNSDGVCVVKAQLFQQTDAVPLLRQSVGVVVDALARWNISRVQLQKGGQQCAVIGDHQIAGVAVPNEGPEVVHLGHLVLNGDREIGIFLHHQLYAAVHDLGLGVISVIEQQLCFAFAFACTVRQQQAECQ